MSTKITTQIFSTLLDAHDNNKEMYLVKACILFSKSGSLTSKSAFFFQSLHLYHQNITRLNSSWGLTQWSQKIRRYEFFFFFFLTQREIIDKVN